ncbi:hypothetical protein [Dyadobacter sp. CY312]|uniref:hypothetical protein n=1 Tax=Dyadobacter sp. CY312 TaxID=2907303 RepID=UPI001F25D415|nr:hypothetical protein [Dyadobacter sp. CY312]MCE7038796.1 hypothetical protein [Dyadobacter sp. CY312]
MKIGALVLLSVVLGLVSGQFVKAQDESLYKRIREIEADTSKDNLQYAAWQFSFIGEYQKAMAAYDSDIEGNSDPKAKEIPKDLKPQPAVEYILNLSRNSQVVILNEAHHQPLHRVFTESLLQGLYNNGFRYLGLEALAEDSLINIRKYPLQSDGYYTVEPQFGNMLRKALELGFTVFGYEADSSGSVREKGQAANINKILLKDPTAKMLIHCGFSHVIEGPVPNWGKAMAGELKELTGINPLTIDQVDLTEQSSENYESGYYLPDGINEPTVFINPKGEPVNLSTDSRETDLQIMHPRSQLIHGRPNWLLRGNSYKPFKLDKLAHRIKFPCLVAAFRANESKDSVPVDQIEVNNHNDKALMLPAGKYRIVLTDADGKIHEKITTIL